MSMDYIRKTYGVPAKKGMRVRPKSGVGAGREGFIRAARDGLLTVVDCERGKYGWWGRYHPDDLVYLPANAIVTGAEPAGGASGGRTG